MTHVFDAVRPLLAWTVGLLAFLCGIALAQVPIPVQEQIRLFNSMSPAQQQSLIRELQRSLPPAQREAIIGLLQGEGGDAASMEGIDPDSEEALRAALDTQATDATEEPIDGVPLRKALK